MKKVDRFLIGIVAGIALLVVAAILVALLRPKPAYQPEDTPEGVVHNYLFALQERDYGRAYGYLSPTIAGYPPSVAAFTNDVLNYSWSFQLGDSTALEVESSQSLGETGAIVTVRKTSFYQGDLLDSSESSYTFDVTLTRAAGSGEWKIVRSNSYFAYCWMDEHGCP